MVHNRAEISGGETYSYMSFYFTLVKKFVDKNYAYILLQTKSIRNASFKITSRVDLVLQTFIEHFYNSYKCLTIARKLFYFIVKKQFCF